jgi:hypothetical protein
MPFVFKRLALLMSIAAAFAADKPTPFRADPAASYPHHQTAEGVTIGADAYAAGEKLKTAFGKLDPNQYGILPVLVVIQNDTGKTIRLDRLKAAYTAPGGNRIDATPASEVKFANPAERPSVTPLGIKSKKNPLAAWEIEGRALAAQTVAPGQSAFGFLYFQTAIQSGSTIYLNGLTEAGSGKELLYFEIPLK